MAVEIASGQPAASPNLVLAGAAVPDRPIPWSIEAVAGFRQSPAGDWVGCCCCCCRVSPPTRTSASLSVWCRLPVLRSSALVRWSGVSDESRCCSRKWCSVDGSHWFLFWVRCEPERTRKVPRLRVANSHLHLRSVCVCVCVCVWVSASWLIITAYRSLWGPKKAMKAISADLECGGAVDAAAPPPPPPAPAERTEAAVESDSNSELDRSDEVIEEAPVTAVEAGPTTAKKQRYPSFRDLLMKPLRGRKSRVVSTAEEEPPAEPLSPLPPPPPPPLEPPPPSLSQSLKAAKEAKKKRKASVGCGGWLDKRRRAAAPASSLCGSDSSDLIHTACDLSTPPLDEEEYFSLSHLHCVRCQEVEERDATASASTTYTKRSMTASVAELEWLCPPCTQTLRTNGAAPQSADPSDSYPEDDLVDYTDDDDDDGHDDGHDKDRLVEDSEPFEGAVPLAGVFPRLAQLALDVIVTTSVRAGWSNTVFMAPFHSLWSPSSVPVPTLFLHSGDPISTFLLSCVALCSFSFSFLFLKSEIEI